MRGWSRGRIEWTSDMDETPTRRRARCGANRRKLSANEPENGQGFHVLGACERPCRPRMTSKIPGSTSESVYELAEELLESLRKVGARPANKEQEKG